MYLWCQSGDFIMSDNLAVGHEAHPSTQLSPDIVGLGIMHRTTVKRNNTKKGGVIHAKLQTFSNR